MPYRQASTENLNAALALADRVQLRLDRLKRRRTDCLGVGIPLALIPVAGYLVPVAIPVGLACVMGCTLIVGVVLVAHAVLVLEPTIQETEEGPHELELAKGSVSTPAGTISKSS